MIQIKGLRRASSCVEPLEVLNDNGTVGDSQPSHGCLFEMIKTSWAPLKGALGHLIFQF